MNQLVINSHDAKFKLFGGLAINLCLAAYFTFVVIVLFQPLSSQLISIRDLNFSAIPYFLLILSIIFAVFICLKNIFQLLLGRIITIDNHQLVLKDNFSELQKVNLLSVKEIVSENRRSSGKSFSFVQIVFYDANNSSLFTCSNVEFFSKRQLGQLLFHLQKNLPDENIKFVDNIDLIKEYQYPSKSIFRYLTALVVILPFVYFSYIILSGGIKYISLFLAGLLLCIALYLATYSVEDLV
ncbi:MAG: hypothetical protein ACOZAR_02575 [Patescibacteria group bacterium]